MSTLHANSISDQIFVPKEGQRDLACSNKKSLRCPSLDVIINNPSEDVMLDYLARILVGAFLDKKNGYKK